MIYEQDTMEKCIFPIMEDNPFSYLEKRKIDTVEARKKTLAIIGQCKGILSLIDKVENDKWKLFKDELPKEKTHILIKREYEDEVFAEWEDAELYEKVDYLTGILEDNVLRAGDRQGAINTDVRNKEIQEKYYWKYIEE